MATQGLEQCARAGIPDVDRIVLGKRRFKVDWDRLKTRCQLLGITVDWEMVGNKTIAYQPLSAQSAAPGGETHLFDPILLVHDKFNNRIIRLVDLTNWSAT